MNNESSFVTELAKWMSRYPKILEYLTNQFLLQAIDVPPLHSIDWGSAQLL